MSITRPSARLALLLLAFLVTPACRSVDTPAPAAEPDSSDDGTARLDAHGEPPLEASDVTVSGVVLPVGLRHSHDVDGAPVFRTRASARRLVDYFAARHGRDGLERIGDGGVFRRVPVVLEDGSRRAVTISVLARSSGGARVEVRLLPEPASEPGDPDARMRELVEQVRTLD